MRPHRPPLTSVVVAFAAVIAMFLAACDGSTARPATGTSGGGVTTPEVAAPTAIASVVAGGQPTAATPECQLITRQEAGVVLGLDPGPGYLDVTPTPQGEVRVCRYGPHDNGTLVSYIAIGLTRLSSTAAATAELEKQRSFFERVMVEGAVTNINGAVMVSDIVTNNNATIFFARGSAVVKITVTLAGATVPPTQTAIGLAVKATTARVSKAAAR
jgi:hypothetical protein